MRQLRVGFLSCKNYFDRTAFSGVLFHMYNALKARDLQVIELGSPDQPSRLQNLVKRLSKRQAASKLGSSRYMAESKKFAAQVQYQLRQKPCDIILAPVASKELIFLETTTPIIYLSDTTCKLYSQYYQLNLDHQELAWKENEESTAIAKASKLVYSSEWAANSAICDYQAETAKIEIIPFGANIDEPPLADEVLSPRPNSPCRLLFMGRDWQRKGGDIAYQTLISLHQQGMDTELIVVGSTPPTSMKSEKLTVIPFLNQNIPQERQQFEELFLTSHFLISPTRADCSPMVFCDANAFGLPVLTTDVGGISTIINEGKNGYMLPLSASGEDYANLIAQTFSNPTRYAQLVSSSREEYDKRLNWNKWAERIHYLSITMVESEELGE